MSGSDLDGEADGRTRERVARVLWRFVLVLVGGIAAHWSTARLHGGEAHWPPTDGSASMSQEEGVRGGAAGPHANADGPVRYKLVFAYLHHMRQESGSSRWTFDQVSTTSPLKIEFKKVHPWEGDIEHILEFPQVLEFRHPPARVPVTGGRPPREFEGAFPSMAAVSGLTHDAVFRVTCSGTASQMGIWEMADLGGEPRFVPEQSFAMAATSEIKLPVPSLSLMTERTEGPDIPSISRADRLRRRGAPTGWHLRQMMLSADWQKRIHAYYGMSNADQFTPVDVPLWSVRRDSVGKPERFQDQFVHEMKVPAGSGVFWTVPAGFAVDRNTRSMVEGKYDPANPDDACEFIHRGSPQMEASIRVELSLSSGSDQGTRLFLLFERDDRPAQPIVALEAFDANPQYYGGKLPEQLSADELHLPSPLRHGAAADGVSQLILRAEVRSQQNVTMAMKSGRGSIKPMLDGQTVRHGEAYYSYALYTPPARFGGGAVTQRPPALLDPAAQPKQRLDGILECEDFEVEAAFAAASDASTAKTLRLKLVRPPVVLVHGLFSNPFDCWVATKTTGTSMVVLLERSGFSPFLVNYESSNGADPAQRSSFADNRRVVWDTPSRETGAPLSYGWLTADHQAGWLGIEGEPPVLSEFQRPAQLRIGGIKQALEYYRQTLNVAATQSDVIGHSMGGLLARVYASDHYHPDYRRAENFHRGDICRLVTICTPHHGSELPEVKDVIVRARLESADGREEAFLPWARRVLYRSAIQWFLDPEPAAIQDLRPESRALTAIGATPIPSFAIATQYVDSAAVADSLDSQGLYFHLYAGLGMVFFYNEALLDSFIIDRAERWAQAGEHQRRTDVTGQPGWSWQEERPLAEFRQAFRSALDHNVMYWIRRREGAYRERVRQTIEAQRLFPYGVVDNDVNESWLGDPFADLEGLLLGGELSAMRRVDREPDVPFEVIAMLRQLVFHNDPQNDGAVRVASQVGDLDRHVVLDGIMHSFAPWHYSVQRQCIDLLKWQDSRFSTEGFGPTGRPLPKYQPIAAFRHDRVEGQQAVDWTGMVSHHAQVIARLADEQDLVLIYRPVNRDCTPLIALDCATKNMLIKGKSSDWGPQRGLIPREQRFSKFWTLYRRDPARRDKKVREFNEITEKMLAETVYPADDDPEAQAWIGRRVAVPRPLVVRIANADYDVLFDPLDPDCESALWLRAVGGTGYYDWRNVIGARTEIPRFDPEVPPLERQPSPEVMGRLRPLDVLADGLSDAEPRPYLTADYDLLAIGYRNSPDFHGQPKELEDLKRGRPHPTRGYITSDQRQLVRDLNQAVQIQANYRGGNVTHHGPENQYPGSPYVDYPLLVFDPGAPGVGDGSTFAIRQGPPGFRDLHLKRYFEAKIRDRINLYPNADAAGWQWEGWRPFSIERGYDPRDAARLPPYIEEAPRPETSR